jgi:hypothetical protein
MTLCFYIPISQLSWMLNDIVPTQAVVPLEDVVRTRRRLQQSTATDLSSRLSSLQASLSSALNASAAASAMSSSSKTVNVGPGYMSSLVAMSDAIATQAALIQAAINTAGDGITRSLGDQQDREEDAYDSKVCATETCRASET